MTRISRLAGLCLATAAVAPAWGMSCAMPPLPVMVQAHQHIFVAQVKSATLQEDKQSIEATFEVERVLKGQPQQVNTIRSSFNDHNYQTDGALIAMWQPDLAPGMHLLVFATGNGPAEFGGCSATTRLQRHDDARLEAIRKLVADTAR